MDKNGLLTPDDVLAGLATVNEWRRMHRLPELDFEEANIPFVIAGDRIVFLENSKNRMVL